jgi:hypothetical protein
MAATSDAHLPTMRLSRATRSIFISRKSRRVLLNFPTCVVKTAS